MADTNLNVTTNTFVPDPFVNQGPQLNLVVWLLVSVSAVFLFTRLHLKHCQHRGLWWDDYALLAAWLCLAVEAGLNSYVISLGYGRQLIPPENLARFPLPIAVLSTLLILANLCGKVSFAMTLLRIPAPWMRWALCGIVLSLAGTLGASAVLVWAECPIFDPLREGCVTLEVAIPYNTFSCGMSVWLN